ncbi:aldose epimerase family protein [Polymorphobacter fuscus]|uniref:Aldose 1-epimerase n=1 Tax=Sandarakinorhabdus fusca TaxID=1439888 RepID=A0A7C9KJ97_9SPHN|nr:aldose epimerase family protein [Polymorphobacter fuscus]KAB7644878.1 galactose mutarotase [Polymorphobacter fuscus]MQT18160.1 galactose-1-epimerase [Polymorphobacter fuscus]NJC09478.1 aldose 1-epimerase [Polymorphobacter fuscus]
MITVERTSSLLPDGRRCGVFRLTAAGGIAVTIAELGATIMRIDAPDREGRLANVVLGFDDIARYPAAGGPGGDACLGGSCGRVANRVAGARITIDGRDIALAANDGPNQLHGGPDGFHRRLWQGEALADGVRLTLDSPDGDQGWPGVLRAEATMRLIAPDTLAIRYRATTDRATHVNLVNHAYFNLDGGGTILDHRLTIAADTFLPIDTAALPTGERRSVAGSPFDFRQPRTIAEAMRQPDGQLPADLGFNHCYVLPAEGLKTAARLSSPRSGRWLALATDQPGLQFYDGYALGRGGSGFADRAGVALEAQAWPNSPNRPDFPSTRLDPGGSYTSELQLQFGAEG